MPSGIGERYIVGKKYERWATGENFIQAHYDGIAWQFVIGFPDISDAELKNINDGSIGASFVTTEGCLFLLLKVGDIPWCDAPYEPRLEPDDLFYPRYNPGTGIPLMIMGVDTTNGELKALRVVGLGHVLSQKLHQTCRDIKKKKDFSLPKYDSKLQSIYQKYPVSEAFLSLVEPGNIYILVSEDTKK